MANPSPVQTKEFLEAQYAREDGNARLSKTPLSIRLEESVLDALKKTQSASVYIRAAIAEKLERDGLLPQKDEI